MKLLIALPSTFFLMFASPAFAKSHHYHYHHRHYATHRYHHHYRYRHQDEIKVARVYHDGRPSAWCGWFMRQLEHVADRAFNLAANWAHYGHAVSPQVGAIVVWPHHVGKIVGGSPGHWAVLSGNDGHRVRTRVRSLAGAIAFRE